MKKPLVKFNDKAIFVKLFQFIISCFSFTENEFLLFTFRAMCNFFGFDFVQFPC